LLIDSDLAIEEVDRRMGHADPFHFCRIFKKRHGMSLSHAGSYEGDIGRNSPANH
jgi:YesN/AraC family two-component response regulator